MAIWGPVLQDENYQAPVVSWCSVYSWQVGTVVLNNLERNVLHQQFLMFYIFSCCCVNVLLCKQQHGGHRNYN